MKYRYKKNYLTLFTIIVLFFTSEAFSKSSNIQHSKINISNYFSGIISANQDYTDAAFDYLKKVQYLKGGHSNFDTQFIRTLVLLEKFEEAFSFSKKIWVEKEYFYEADLLLGLQSFINQDYLNAEKHFQRLNRISEHNLLFDDFMGNILITWIKAAENNKEESFKFFNKIPERYYNLKQIQNSFLQCYFNTTKTEIAFEKLISSEDFGFSRYHFFLVNYFLSKNQIAAAEILIDKSRNIYNSNLLIEQAENFILNDDSSFF